MRERVALVQKKHPQVKSLRDVSAEMHEEVKQEMEAAVYKRCLYIIEVNERLLRGCELLEKGDIKALAQKCMVHIRGCQPKDKVSCAELDWKGVAKKRTISDIQCCFKYFPLSAPDET